MKKTNNKSGKTKTARPASGRGTGAGQRTVARPGFAPRAARRDPGRDRERLAVSSLEPDKYAGRTANATGAAFTPELLAPAGDMSAALAAIAAGADALYLGLKHFSARMQADNFSTSDLAALADLAHARGKRIHVAMNTLIKPGDPAQVYRLVRRLAADVAPDALIIQDPAMFDLARQAGFTGQLHLSTLANATHPKALLAASKAGVARVVVPRELSFDELVMLDSNCPEELDLETFVHGALCYCVSGRCWWSSYMGGKSGLRGRCVQPCRRVYAQKGREGRFFSSLDLALDGQTARLLTLPKIRAWKIEGRKKSPHYVYHVTSAYRLLRDEADNPQARKEARRILGLALGRGSTTARFIGGGAAPVAAPRGTPTSSGLLVGKVTGNRAEGYFIRPRIDLLPRDLLRVGYEDEPWHQTILIPGNAEAGQNFALRPLHNKYPEPGTPVFLIDRKEKELTALVAELTRELARHNDQKRQRVEVGHLEPAMPVPLKETPRKALDIRLRGWLPHGREGKADVRPGAVMGLWLSPKALRDVSRTLYSRISWWLPPVIWPDEEALWQRLIVTALRDGARHWVLNAPWQTAFFARPGDVALTAGPFCNIANAPALGVLRDMGFTGAVVSPELGEADFLALPGQSPLPLGIVIAGFWPVGITRHSPEGVKDQESFSSPKGESFWLRRYGRNTWIYPVWPLDLGEHRPALERAGYSTFIHMEEYPPKGVEQAKRAGEFNWKVDVL